jgi:protein-disulfide isomerase
VGRDIKAIATSGIPVRLSWQILTAMAVVVVSAATASARALPATDSNSVLAEVGNHKITEQQVDSRIELQLYNARKAAIDQMVDDYVLKQAAAKEKLSVPDYLKREADDKAAAEVTDAAAHKFYDDNKDKIAALRAAGSYDKIKDRLIAALRQSATQQKREELLARLRKEADVKVLLQPPRVEVSADNHPTLGPKNAPVTIVEFGDFQCPFCRGVEGTLKTVREKYGDRVRLIYVDFPLSFHSHAMQAASAARCAGEQGKFWQYHDALFADQSKLAPGDLKATAKKLGLNTAKFDACFDKGRYDDAIKNDQALGQRLDVNGTPTFYIDGRSLVGAQPEEKFSEIIDDELAPATRNKQKAGGNGNQKTAAAR